MTQTGEAALVEDVDHAGVGHLGHQQVAQVVQRRGEVEPAREALGADGDEALALLGPLLALVALDPGQVAAELHADVGQHRRCAPG